MSEREGQPRRAPGISPFLRPPGAPAMARRGACCLLIKSRLGTATSKDRRRRDACPKLVLSSEYSISSAVYGRRVIVRGQRLLSCQRGSIMANTTKLPVEKVLEKIRSSDSSRSKSVRREEEMAALDEETKRMRAQRLRLEADQRKQK